MMSRWTVPVIFVVAALLWGCDATTRYHTLRFFFDGVPSPEEEEAARIKRTEAGGGPNKAPVLTAWGRHGPYAAKQCEACHQRPTNALVAPIDELCFRCHEFRSDKQWVHGPLASGGCRVCHEPHSSRYPYLLVAETELFCFQCHDEKAVRAGEAHQGATEKCTTCHDAHMSDNRFLLK